MNEPLVETIPDSRPARPAAWLFVLFLVAVPVVQLGDDLREDRSLQVAELGAAIAEGRPAEFEDQLGKSSWIRRHVVPHYQSLLTEFLGHGNERALEGRDGWLYYGDDIELITGPGYFEAGRSGERALEVIAHFRDELAAHGVELLVLPVPVKGMIDGERLQWPPDAGAPNNADHARFLEGLRERGVAHLDLLEWMLGRADEGPQFLARDTHWTPETMEAVASLVARRIEQRIGAPDVAMQPKVETTTFEAAGDLVELLRLPGPPRRFPPMVLDLRQVLRLDGSPWRSSERAEVVVLGDSFTGAFSDPRLGLGESAGFAEHLSLALGRPVDVIALAGGAATAVRRSLALRPDGVAGKKIVVWQFAFRNLADPPSSWAEVPLGEAPRTGPDAGGLRVRAEVVETSEVPEDFDYERCLAVFEYRVLQDAGELAAGDRLWVAHLAVEGREPTPQSRFEVGEVHLLRLAPIAEHHDLEEVSWVDDTMFEGPIWWPVEHSLADEEEVP